MKKFLAQLNEWIAERLLAAAAVRAIEIAEEATKYKIDRKLEAPELPRLTFYSN